MNTTELDCRRQEIAQIPDKAGDHPAPCLLVGGRFGPQWVEQTNRRNHMRPVMTAWQDRPDAAPDRHTICRRIEYRNNPRPVPATS